MGIEIERKFLVGDTTFLEGLEGEPLQQGYLVHSQQLTVRVRIGAGRAWLTLKGATTGISRSEFEYPLPLADAQAMLEQLSRDSIVRKTRFRVSHQQHLWEVDVFEGDNAGLVLAEIELGSEQEVFARPAWLGKEVSDDPRYANSQLARNPFCGWKDRD